jgi:hypothetical protein
MIRNGHVMHPELARAIDVFADSPHPVKERILGVEMKMSELIHRTELPRVRWT